MKNLLKCFGSITMLAIVMLFGTSMTPSSISADTETLMTTDVNEHFFGDLADCYILEAEPAGYICGRPYLKYRKFCGSCTHYDGRRSYLFRVTRYTYNCYYPNSPEFSWTVDTGDLCEQACY